MVGIYSTELKTPLNFSQNVHNLLVKPFIFVLQVTYMEISLSIDTYDIYPQTPFPKDRSNHKLYICFEGNDLLSAERASNLIKLGETEENSIKRNLKGSRHVNRVRHTGDVLCHEHQGANFEL